MRQALRAGALRGCRARLWNTATAFDVLDGRARRDDYTGVYDEFAFEPGVTELTGEGWLDQGGEVEGDA